MSKTIKCTKNQYFAYEPGTLFPVMVTPPSADYLVPSEQQGTHSLWNDYGGDGQALLLSTFNGIGLAPSSSVQMVDMDISDFSGTDIAKFATLTVYPGIAHIYLTDGTANLTTTITGPSLPEEPWFSIRLLRSVIPANGQTWENMAWAFAFGDGYELVWSALNLPYITYDGEIISTYNISNEERSGFWAQPSVIFHVTNAMGSLTIESNVLSGAWTVANIGTLPSAPYTITSHGGQYVFNVSPKQFQTEGYVLTPWIDHGYTFNPDDLIWQTYPMTQPTGTSVDVTVEAEDGDMKQYRLTLTGDGTHTPIVQSIYLEYQPTFSTPPVPVAYNITPWVHHDDESLMGPTEEHSLDMTPRALSFELRPGKIINGQTFFEYTGGLVGQVPFSYEIGYVYTDGTEEVLPRMVGFIPFAEDNTTIGDLRRIPVRAKDRWKQLAECKLFAPPCVQGRTVAEAITVLASFAGISPDDMLCDEASGTVVLDDPGEDYTSPTWLPQRGTTAAEVIKQICQAKGFYCWFSPTGKLVVYGLRSASVEGTYTILPTDDPTQALTKFVRRTDLEDICNGVYGEGMGPDGQKYSFLMADWDSVLTPGSPRYVGYPTFSYVQISDCTDPTSLTAAVAGNYAERRAGWAMHELEGDPATALWSHLPHMTIQATDKEVVLRSLLVVHVKQQLGLHFNHPTIMAEERGV